MQEYVVRVSFPGIWDVIIKAETPEVAQAEAVRRWGAGENDQDYELNAFEGVTAEILPA